MKASKSMSKSLEEYSEHKRGGEKHGKGKKCPECGMKMPKGKCKKC